MTRQPSKATPYRVRVLERGPYGWHTNPRRTLKAALSAAHGALRARDVTKVEITDTRNGRTWVVPHA